MSNEPEIPSEQLSSTHQEASTHNSNNQTSFPTQYYSYYPMRYNNMGCVQPSYLHHQTLHNMGYAPLQYFPYYQTMYNHLIYTPSQFPYHQSPYNYAGYVQPQFTSPPAYDSTATVPPAPPPPSPLSPPSLSPSPPQPQESLPSTTSMPSRTLLLGVMPTLVTEATLRHELEAFGDIRAVQMERLHEGFVTVHFYNMRDAEDVLAAICQRNTQQPPTGRGVISEQVTWADFTVPEPSAFPNGDNQGTIVVFNLDSWVSSDYLKEIFEEFGPVKEVRETPHKNYQKFIEFYDVRDAARAKEQMNGKKIHDRKIIIQYARAGRYNKNQDIGPSSFRSNRSTSNILPPRNLPPRLRRRPLNTAVECKLSGRVSLWKDLPEGEYSRTRGGSDSSDPSATTNLSFSGQLEYSNIVLNENQNIVSTRINRLRNNPRFKIAEYATTDSRTTVMIRNIPNKFTQGELINLLDNLCMEINAQTVVVAGDEPPSSYDYVYLPIDFTQKSNMGYAFVNMTSPQAAIKLYKAFHRQTWHDAFNSNKICEVSYARIQGMEAIKDHFKNSKLPMDSENMPMIFSPPRDGQTLTDPLPIFYSDSPLPPQRPVSPPSTSTSKEDQLEVPPAEAAEDGDDETGSDKNDDDGVNYFLHMHGLA